MGGSLPFLGFRLGFSIVYPHVMSLAGTFFHTIKAVSLLGFQQAVWACGSSLTHVHDIPALGYPGGILVYTSLSFLMLVAVFAAVASNPSPEES